MENSDSITNIGEIVVPQSTWTTLNLVNKFNVLFIGAQQAIAFCTYLNNNFNIIEAYGQKHEIYNMEYVSEKQVKLTTSVTNGLTFRYVTFYIP